MRIPSSLLLILLSKATDSFVVLTNNKSTLSKSSWQKSCKNTQVSPSFSSPQLKMGVLDDIFTPTAAQGTTTEELQKQNKDYIAKLQTRVEKINALEPSMEDLGDDEIQAKTDEFKKRLQEGEDIFTGSIVEEAFALVREAAWRVLELRHYDVQLLGGLILHEGRLAEMATGEGKTLVATLPCYLNALDPNRGDYPVFVVTVNDYLARRDAEKMGQVHRYLGLKVGCIQSDMESEERKKIYKENDIVYVTNSELGFDYLRDHLSLSTQGTVLPASSSDSKKKDGMLISELNGFCIVDEADSVLIDEARTPLIISKQVPAPAQQYIVANQLATALQPKLHYTIDFKNKNVILKDRGYRACENALNIQNLFEVTKEYGAWAPFVLNAIKAKELFEKDVDYTVLVDEQTKEKVGVGIIDSFTGRVMDGRRWSDGLHQSIEAKEEIGVSSQSKVIAKITYQSLFRQFTRLAGMTGTASSDAIEFDQVYNLQVTPVPTALPIARRDYPDVVFKTRQAANKALIDEVVAAVDDQDRPCLIGTTSISSSEVLVEELSKRGIEAEILNALPKNAARESEIIAQAGRVGAVTVATNMAGRGTDIVLGGCANTMARIKLRSLIVDLLVKDEKELEKMPPNPEEDYYPTSNLPDDVNLLIKEAVSGIQKHISKSLTALELEDILTVVTDTTESEEDPDYIIRLRDVLEIIKDNFKPILDEEKDTVKSKGGLYVMGTNRHESSRIDNQLRGRSGRQGDPGTSRFFLSFEDDIFVIFGGDGLQNMLSTFRVSDDMPIEAQSITNSLNKVQLTVEEKYREIRSQILEFDLVLEGQRRVVYAKRQNILFATPEETIDLVKSYHDQSIQDIVNAQIDNETGDINSVKVFEKMIQFFPSLANVMTLEDIGGYNKASSSADLISYLTISLDELFKLKIEQKGLTAVAKSSNYILLVSIDNAWSDHLQNMENLKESVILRKYQNLDPVAEYKREAFDMFKGLEDSMRLNAIFSLWQSFNN